jgi:uncharacterized membrane protein
MDWQELWEIGSVPNNVFVMSLILMLIYSSPAWKRAMLDDLIAESETSPAIAKTHRSKIWLAKVLLHSCFWHWIGIPLVALGLKIVHFWRARKDGISRPEPVELTSKRDGALAEVTHT